LGPGCLPPICCPPAVPLESIASGSVKLDEGRSRRKDNNGRFEAFELEGRFFINPGSATGAFSTNYFPPDQEPVPSFCLMDVQGDVLVLYVYQLKTDANGAETVAVEKVSFRKQGVAVP